MNKNQKAQNLLKGKEQLEMLVAYDYRVVQFSDYHHRINDRLDVWLSTRRWWDMKRGYGGTYDNLFKFVKLHLPNETQLS